MKTKIIQAQVESITPLTNTIMQLILLPEEYVAYQAGQYLRILFNQEELSYSIANAPLGSHRYELHIRHSLDNPSTQSLLNHITKQGTVTLQLPFGDCSVPQLEPDCPILFIAGGTGFAPVKAMIEQLLARSDPRPLALFWGARSKNDLYLDEKVRSWQMHLDHFKYHFLLSDENNESLATAVLAEHEEDLHAWQIVLSGPFDMVYSIRDVLVHQGISPRRLFSDAFSFE